MTINTIPSLLPRGNGIMEPSVSPRNGPGGSGRRDVSNIETDKVQLTSGGVRLHQEATTSEKGPPMDTVRIEALRKAIASGEYRVDSQRLAMKMMKFEANLP